MSKMALAIIFAVLALVSVYAAIFYVPLAIQSINAPDAELRAAELSGNLSWMTRWGMAVLASISVALTVVFSWFGYRFAKKWRQF